MSKTVLVTGPAGFIGSHAVETLLKRGDRVVGIDNFNDYYDPKRKRANIKEIESNLASTGQFDALSLIEGDIRDRKLVQEIFQSHPIDAVVHLAAMAGVRVSIEAPGTIL